MDPKGDEEMQTSSSSPQQFGQRRPPLSVTIRGILERYPDGQIFKEIIQNADDAGAKTVWFYVDERQHDTSNLPHPDLVRFQGPALVAANDACFTEADWEGIQSLQQSVKAEDPFKVGRFGIGFNSVYHLTDLPIIASGKRLACFEPQEKMWKGESGQAFQLSDLISQSSDFVAPLNGLADFDSHSVRYGGYSQTIFRLPLRREASGLSDNIYNTQKLLELLDALREEAKYLLLFLKSVCKIQVIHISQNGQHSTSFCVEIAPDSLATVSDERDSFMQQLKQAHAKQPYQITNIISFTAKFSVVVTDNNPDQNGTSNWLIANCAGSADNLVLAAAAKQRIFPWVGGALELGGGSVGGRIFCFLPMPMEAASGLPIHVNGTFGLNDDRRSLKWPGIERKNDPTANWNKILVSKLLPPCYAMLLTVAKNHLPLEQFYKAWPDVQVVNNTQFSEILQPLFTALFTQAIVWTEKTEAPQEVGNWILTSKATFISKGSSLPSVMKKVLSSCGVQLVTVPAVIWQALWLAKNFVTEVSPKLARSNMRSNPESYSTIDQYDKRVILTYCLSDSCYGDLSELNLLPLANNSFTTFNKHFGDQDMYLCSDDCPRSLLPNLDHLLVDLSDDSDLQMALYQVAASQQTRLRVLTEREVATLLTQVMSSNWRSSSLVSMPHSQLPSTWLQTFWNWLKNKNLGLFSNQLIVPCYVSIFDSTSNHHLTRLNSAQPVVCVSSNTSYPSSLLSALYKMNVRVCLQSEFSFVEHKQLSSCIREYNTNNMLDVIYSQSNYKGIVFTADEADSLRTFLVSNTCSPTNNRKDVMLNLTIFSCTSNPQKMYSISSAASQSVTKKALGEPSNCAISVSNLPPSLILFSRENYQQLQLLQHLQIPFSSDYTLLVDYVFPLIRNENFPDPLIDNLMPEVLDMFQVLNSRESSSRLSESLKNLPFVKTEDERMSPTQLFTPLNCAIKVLYSGEDVFPQSPYNTPDRIQVLISCGLQTTVTPQQVLDIIYSISSDPARSYPQQVDSTKLSRARAVLKYISTPSFHSQILRGDHSFSIALQQLATNRCWLPVCSSRPTDYCKELSWKGNGYNSHFISLSSSVVVLSTLTAPTLPHLVGSQMYLISPTVSPQIAAMLSTDSASIAQHVVAHFKEVLAHKDQLSVEVMDTLAHRVYMYMNSEGASCLRQLYSIAEWVYIKRENKLIPPAVIALKQNHTFRRDLEPYVYILPDSLSQYTALFGTASGVNPTVSQDQILSILNAIREEVESETHRISAEEAWDLVISILNWLTSNGSKGVDQSIDVYVPVETESEWPQLVTASKVVYTDNDFMKNYLQSSDEKNEYTFVHERIGTRLAHAVDVAPLTEFLDISEDTFEDAGQHEPLTTRLKNILRDYKDGLTIIKELLQNADDAEATEVNICYDTRQHETNPKKLFFSGMAEAHGPALIVHNNSTFSEDDFKNITKLAGATKQGKALKIGKFGVGFCSVYHMTDAPSFISREHFYIFDPTLAHLSKEIKNPAQPGKKTKFTHKFISRSRQLSPYDGLFGFDRSEYKGTMFRLPFRTHASELSGTCYTEATVGELISAIRESSTNLLLFLQHVRKIAFHRIDQGQTTPQVLLEITRENMSPSLSLSFPTGTEIRKLSCTSSSDDTNSCQWLVSQTKMKDDSQENYSTASVACPLGSSEYKVDASFEGEIFCFLPLSQRTGLPVHVSSNFAVINNRRGIWTSDEATSENNNANNEVSWNVTLMKGVIPQAYHTLLLALKQLLHIKLLEKYTFHCLWPLVSNLQQHNPWVTMVNTLYELIAQSSLFYSKFSNSWLSISECKFFQDNILSESISLDCVLIVLQKLGLPIVDLPVQYRKMFVSFEIIGEATFLELFFKNFSNLGEIAEQRNLVIRHMLEVYATEYDDKTERGSIIGTHLQNNDCIPCTPDGRVFRACSKIIDPRAKFAPLFSEDESYFPVKELTERHLAMDALLKMGMISETIPWKVLIERAQTVPALYQKDKKEALFRVSLIVTADTNTSSDELDITFDSIPFLPVLQTPPPTYPLSWKGEETPLLCGKELVRLGPAAVNSYLSGTQVAFVCESNEGGCGHIPEKMIRILGIQKGPTVDNVVSHLKELIRHVSSQQELYAEVLAWTTTSCEQIYQFLNSKLQSTRSTSSQRWSYSQEALPAEEVDVSSLISCSCIWTGKEFVKAEVVMKKWTMAGPYLYSLPSSLSNLKLLTEALGIRDEPTLEDIQHALQQMKDDFREKPVNDECKTLLEKLVSPLLQHFSGSSSDVALPDSTPIDIPLPGEDFVMHLSSDLSYNDAPWIPEDGHDQYLYVHDMIPRELAKNLGVKPVRSKMLEGFANPSSKFGGVPFGQHEELTQRIQNILRDYPFDITVLKELLQNADDARATKMSIILDKRKHGTTSILSKNWADLQGPALLVWNDQEFTEADLRGIQKLGLGSKRSDSETVGQYGIGFNVVYHLTDCPSFITGGETMCVLDPHCKYVHGARAEKPGMRYDHLTAKLFWEKFPDMKSSFLLEGLSNAPDFSKGSLFRFPLRSTQALVDASKVLDHSSYEHDSYIVTAAKMDTNLCKWAPEMKSAMLFLNHIHELQFFVVENDHTLVKVKHFQSSLEEASQELRGTLHTSVSAFNQKSGSTSSVVKYPLTIREIAPHETQGEKWLIQQGIGDIENERQHWKFIKTVKPRHGVAAPLDLVIAKPRKAIGTSHNGQGLRLIFSTPPSEKFSGQVFCFLPLPLKSKLPLHINGNFVLHSNRRDLWHETTPGEEDPRTEWNHSLFQAIASSYANFLENSQSDYVPHKSYMAYHDALKDVNHYYEVFPSSNPKDLEGPYLQLAKNMYKTLLNNNAHVLGVVSTIKPASTEEAENSKDHYCVQWHPISSLNGATQVYFERGLDKKLSLVFESIGMKLTKAPLRIRDHLNNEIGDKAEKVKQTTSETVFSYYCQYSHQASETGSFPCSLVNSVFKTSDTFKLFLNYVLQTSREDPKIREFPGQPFGRPVLLTADGTLRELSQVDKVIHSTFAHLFPKSLRYFLHPNLLDIPLSLKLFVCMDDIMKKSGIVPSIANMPEYSLVKNILSKEVPSELQGSQVCTDFESFITKKQLQSLWGCFVSDGTFKFFLPILVEQIALLPATNGCLYSTTNQIVPAYPLDSAPLRNQQYTATLALNSGDHTRAFNTLKQLGLPFLDTSLLCGASIDSCPTLQKFNVILKYLSSLYKHNDLREHFSKEVVLTLISYFKAIDFKNDPQSCSYIKYLPLFENTDGTFTALNGKISYVWPSSQICNKGYRKWSKKHNVIFLKPSGDWTMLGSSEQLAIKRLSAVQIYTEYIFPAFSELSEDERYAHLCNIKDKLVDECVKLKNTHNKYLSSDDVERRLQVVKFINDLIDLSCIGGDEEELRPVRHYHNHQIKVFQVFKAHFHFLPEYFVTSKSVTSWLSFFEIIGLKVSLTQDQYLDLCREVSRGEHKDLKEASETLIEYLFSNDVKNKLKWHNDSCFLQTLADISFICTEKLHEYEWICPAAKPCNGVQSGEKIISMAKFKEAALLDQAVLLWTVKPVVTLPGYKSRKQLLEKLQVTQSAEVSHVIQNIKNICGSNVLTSQELFDRYPETLRKPSQGEELITVMSHQFEFLNSKGSAVGMAQYNTLASLSCIPVHTTLDDIFKWQVVLVKPCCVVYGIRTELKFFHPFLHSLPSKLMPIEDFFKKFGVQSELRLSHMQIVLEAAYNVSKGDDLDDNTKKCVVEALKLTYKLLKADAEPPTSLFMITQDGEVKVDKVLSPLYLPTAVGGRLGLSTDLVFADDPSYRAGIDLDLSETRYKELCLEQRVYGFCDATFCRLLPDVLRPTGLSTICKMKVASSCERKENELTKRLKTSLKLKAVSKGCLSTVQAITRRKGIYEVLETPIISFLTNIKVKTMDRLKTSVFLIGSDQKIGNAKMPCFLESSPSSSSPATLYVDSDLEVTEDEPYRLLLDHVMLIIEKENITDANLREIERILDMVLKAKTGDKVKEILDRKGIDLEGLAMEEIEFQIGSEIPQCWKHRLDQRPDNVFHSGEKVGYEKQPGNFIFAEILDPVLPDGFKDFENISSIEMKYKIFIDDEDEDGILVSATDLYKFLRSSQEDDEGALSSDSVTKILQKEDIEEIKKELMKQLDMIWRLPEEEKQKAIKRLYLKWHPDKNPENEEIAEEIFKFLLAEIQRRGNSRISRTRDHWNREAKTHSFYWHFEFKQHEEPSSGSWSGGGGGGGWGGRRRRYWRSGYNPPFDRQDFQIKGNKVEGRRWLRQAEADIRAMEIMFKALSAEPQEAFNACFLAHQVAEKALKAGKSYVCGLTENALKITQLTTHAYGLQHELPGKASGLAILVSPMDDYSQKTRYPHLCDTPSIPATVFTVDQATTAVHNAREVLKIIQSIVV